MASPVFIDFLVDNGSAFLELQSLVVCAQYNDEVLSGSMARHSTKMMDVMSCARVSATATPVYRM